MASKSVRDISLKGRRVLCRVDFNVPLEGGKVRDNKRIAASLETLRYVLEQGGKLVLMSHLGRPDGRRDPAQSLRPVAAELAALLGRKVEFAEDCIGGATEKQAAALPEGGVLLLENLRFHKEEEENESRFAAALAKLGDVYVNDAFGTAHRAHASTEGAARLFKEAVSGFLMQKELDYLAGALAAPRRPFLAIMGGAKVKDKIPVLSHLLPKVDRLILGGGMSYTFIKAQGGEIGRSLLDKDSLGFARELLASKDGKKILLPEDTLATEKLDFAGRAVGSLREVPSSAIPATWEGVDIGPQSIASFGKVIAEAGTIVWNGPMGVFEIDACAKGTMEVAKKLAAATARGAITIVGGGDSAAAAKKAGVAAKMSHVSTGGGASLELLEGKVLPGVAVLTGR